MVDHYVTVFCREQKSENQSRIKKRKLKMQEKLDKEMTSLVDRIGNNLIKPTRKKCFECSMKCCDSKSSMTEFQSCLTRCNQPSEQVEQLFSHELSAFQNKLQRCVMDCQDNIKDKYLLTQNGTSSDNNNSDIIQKEFDSCSANCVTQSISKLPLIEKKLRNQINH